jgi:predicted  nucleic acid-binding Zn-ribbon protein
VETITDHISKLEMDINDIKGKMIHMDTELLSMKGDISTILQLVQKMDTGLYGDSKNKYEGVIDRQHYLEEEIYKLKEEVQKINNKTHDTDITSTTKKGFKIELIENSKELGKWIINIIVIYMILKGLIGADAILLK